MSQLDMPKMPSAKADQDKNKKKQKKRGLFSRLLSFLGLGGAAGSELAGTATTAASATGSAASSAAGAAARTAAGGAAKVAAGGAMSAAAKFFSGPAGMFTLIAGASVGAAVLSSQFGDPSQHTLLNQGFSTFTHVVRDVDENGPASVDQTNIHAEGIKFAGDGGEEDDIKDKLPQGSAAPSSPLSDGMARASARDVDSNGIPMTDSLPKFGDVTGISGGGGGGSGASAAGNGGAKISAMSAAGGSSRGMGNLGGNAAAVGARSARSVVSASDAQSQLNTAAALSKAATMTGNYQTAAAAAGRAFHGSTAGGGANAALDAGGKVTSGGLSGAAANLAANPQTMNKNFSAPNPPPPTQPNDSCSGDHPTEPNPAAAGLDSASYNQVATDCKNKLQLKMNLLWLLGAGLAAFLALEPLTRKSKTAGFIAGSLLTLALIGMIFGFPKALFGDGLFGILSESPSLTVYVLAELGAAGYLIYKIWKEFADGRDEADKDEKNEETKKELEKQLKAVKVGLGAQDTALNNFKSVYGNLNGAQVNTPTGQTNAYFNMTPDQLNQFQTTAGQYYQANAASKGEISNYTTTYNQLQANGGDMSGLPTPDSLKADRMDMNIVVHGMYSGNSSNSVNEPLGTQRGLSGFVGLSAGVFNGNGFTTQNGTILYNGQQVGQISQGANIAGNKVGEPSTEGDLSKQGIMVNASLQSSGTGSATGTQPKFSALSSTPGTGTTDAGNSTGSQPSQGQPQNNKNNSNSNNGSNQGSNTKNNNNSNNSNQNSSNSFASQMGDAVANGVSGGAKNMITGAMNPSAGHSGSPNSGSGNSGGGGGAGASGSSAAPNSAATNQQIAGASADATKQLSNPNFDGTGAPAGDPSQVPSPPTPQGTVVASNDPNAGLSDVEKAMRDLGLS